MSSREVNIRTLQRSWARRPKFAIPLPPPPDAQAQYSCPTCGSENTQRLSTAYMEGVSQFSATTSGFGWLGGPAVANGWTTGTCQTGLAQISAPPQKRSYRQGLLLLWSGWVRRRHWSISTARALIMAIACRHRSANVGHSRALIVLLVGPAPVHYWRAYSVAQIYESRLSSGQDAYCGITVVGAQLTPATGGLAEKMQRMALGAFYVSGAISLIELPCYGRQHGTEEEAAHGQEKPNRAIPIVAPAWQVLQERILAVISEFAEENPAVPNALLLTGAGLAYVTFATTRYGEDASRSYTRTCDPSSSFFRQSSMTSESA